MTRIFAVALLVFLGLVSCGGGGYAQDLSGAGAVDISSGWRFHKDPDDAGRTNRWEGVGLDDSRWTLTDAGGPWEERGAPGYDGVGWYRRWVELPEAWPRTLLALPAVADRAVLFVNGVRVDQEMNRPHAGTDFIVRDISAGTAGQAKFLLALRVVNDRKGQPGGFREGGTPAMLARAGRPLFAEERGWYDYLAQQYPRFPWPAWTRGRGARWLAVGEPGAGGGAIVGLSGQIALRGQQFAVSCCLYEPGSKRFYAAESLDCSLRLENRVVPLPEIDGRVGRLFSLKIRHWTKRLNDPPAMTLGMDEVTVQNATDRFREVDLILMVHPFGPERQPFAIERIEYRPELRTILVNGRPAVVLAGAPNAFGAAEFTEEGTVARFLANGEIPRQQEAVDPTWRLASGAAVYRLRIQPYGARTQTFRVFLEGRPEKMTAELAARVRQVGRKESLAEMARTWSGLLQAKEKMRLRMRDKEPQLAYYASLAHLYVTLPGMRPGAGGGGSLRDGALGIAALLRAGHGDAARGCLEAVVERLDAGSIPGGSMTGENGAGAAAALAQALWALGEYDRFTGDRAILEQAYPAVVNACRSLQRTRYGRIEAGASGLPAAEWRTATGEGGDLWCGAWGVAGWDRAAGIARRLGRAADAAWMNRQGDVLRREIEEAVTGASAGSPPGPVNLLWPCAAISPARPGVAEAYGRAWTRWFSGTGGGCLADQAFLPGAGLSLAHNWMRLGESDRAGEILAWHLDPKNQTVPGAYAWAREVSPETMGHAGGPLPDPRAAAECVCLVRDMLLNEEGDALVLTAGFPSSWAKAGGAFEVKQAPTWFGPFPGFSVTTSPRGMDLRLMQSGSKDAPFAPPGGLKWRIPGGRAIRTLTVGRLSVQDIPADRIVDIPAGTRQAQVTW